jgi:vancomycin resistance protein YoaR
VIAPNVFIGSLDVGRKTPEQAKGILQKRTDELLTGGINVRLDGETKNLPLSTLIGSDLIEYVHFDLEKTLEISKSARHDNNPIVNTNKILYALIRPFYTTMRFSVQSKKLNQSLHTLFIEKEQPASETSFVIKPSGKDWTIEVKPGVSGNKIDEMAFEAALAKSLETLSTEPVDLIKTEWKPLVSESIALQEVPIVRAVLNAAPYHLVYKNANGKEETWKLTATVLAPLLIPTPHGTINMDKDQFNAFIEPIAKAINVPAQNARFEMKSDRAVKFAESKNGFVVDTEKLFEDTLTQITQGSTNLIQIATKEEEPIVKTNEVNNLGITEILGYGTSSYKNSPKNRKVNIQNGVNLLNGLLIAPGETFSLLAALQPFTIENGYVPELVIKGDKIIPDIGGGLCQIGTTTFRTVMYSGLPVDERRNHSLVVNYYNDPSNNNPGTDATIFSPAPDFKFTNNTEHYILFQAENDTTKSELKFTFWGTSDGRKGSYTPPVVKRWIPYGDKVVQTTTTLKPGEEKCQEAHKGADTSFTYTILNPDGTKTDKVFTSHYRPLPKICLVGVDTALETEPILQPE